MAIKKILVEPNKLLRQVSQPVDEVNTEIQKLMDDMLETMYSANGIGLAAIQIGVPKNLIVIDLLTKEKKKNPMFFVNPKILKKSSKMSKYEEGCLSIPNLFAEVQRPSECEIEYLDYEGNKKSLKATLFNKVFSYPAEIITKLYLEVLFLNFTFFNTFEV